VKAVKNIAVAIALTAAALTVARAGSAGEAPGFVSVDASKLKWTDAPSVGPGAKIAVIEGDLKSAEPITFRLKVPANSKIAVHTHPTAERVTVLTGTLYFATGDKFDAAKGKAYKPGDAFIVPSGMPMYAYTKKGETIVQIHGNGPWGISYLNPEDAPGKKK
jgi:quercetin dioxygenase-like cupin family protein